MTADWEPERTRSKANIDTMTTPITDEFLGFVEDPEEIASAVEAVPRYKGCTIIGFVEDKIEIASAREDFSEELQRESRRKFRLEFSKKPPAWKSFIRSFFTSD